MNCMNYKGEELKTFNEIFRVALKLAKENKEESQQFFKQYVQSIFLNNRDKINTIEEAENKAKSNFGYFAAYFDSEVCDIIYNTYQCCHPIYGDKPFES